MHNTLLLNRVTPYREKIYMTLSAYIEAWHPRPGDLAQHPPPSLSGLPRLSACLAPQACSPLEPLLNPCAHSYSSPTFSMCSRAEAVHSQDPV